MESIWCFTKRRNIGYLDRYEYLQKKISPRDIITLSLLGVERLLLQKRYQLQDVPLPLFPLFIIQQMKNKRSQPLMVIVKGLATFVMATLNGYEWKRKKKQQKCYGEILTISVSRSNTVTIGVYKWWSSKLTKGHTKTFTLASPSLKQMKISETRYRTLLYWHNN